MVCLHVALVRFVQVPVKKNEEDGFEELSFLLQRLCEFVSCVAAIRQPMDDECHVSIVEH